MNAETKKPEEHPTNQIQRVEIVREVERADIGIDPLLVIEQRNKLLERILSYAIAATHAGQWVDQGGKPWPTAAAAEVMARRCAVSIKGVKKEKRISTDDKGQFYIWIVEAEAYLPGEYDSMEAMGTCSSRDTFLGTETQAGRQLSEIDEGNILKAAYSNMLVNAVTRLLGVRQLTWEKLAAHGIDAGKVAKVEYASGSKGGGSKSADDFEWKFGRSKGKKLSETPPSDLAWYAATLAKDLADPEKAKFHANTRKQIAAVDAEKARRGAGATPAASESPWERIKAIAIAEKVPPEVLNETVKTVTGKTNAKDLSEEDVAKFQNHLSAKKLAPIDDIQF